MMKASSTRSSVITDAVKEDYPDAVTDECPERRWIGLSFSFRNAWQDWQLRGRKKQQQERDEEGGPLPFQEPVPFQQTVPQSPASSVTARDSAFLELLRSLFGDDPDSKQDTPDIERELLSQCQDWYHRFIDSWIEAAQGPLLKGVLGNPLPKRTPTGLSESEPARLKRTSTGLSLVDAIRSKRTPAGVSAFAEAEKSQLYALMSLVIREMRLRERKGLALTEIVTALQNEGKLGLTDANHECRDIQLLFAIVGWLTMLYEPVTNPESNKLQLEKPSTKRRLRLRRSDVIHNFSVDIVSLEQSASITQQPLYRLLHKFGNLIPCPDDIFDSWEATSSSAIQAMSYGGGDFGFNNSITVHHVCFHTIQKIIKVKVQWVETLNQHLEFDPGKKTLKVFRYPAYLWMMSRNPEFDSVLSRLFEERWSQDDELSSLRPRADDLFREVLLSYRLIFGQDARSRKAYRKQAAKKDRDHENGKWGSRQHPEDPLLPQLCGEPCSSSKSRAIYEAIDIDEEVSKIYTATDFPFLGKRLLQLQCFSKCQNAHGWAVLWHDRRNLSEWWTIWAVLFIGGGTIVIALFTLAFQVLQVY